MSETTQLTGSLLKELGMLTELRELNLWLNSWKSEIPAEFENLVNLEYLNVRDSQLWGGLPPELGALTRMKELYLYNNALTGAVPSTWQSMKQLEELRLSNNYLNGDVPSWIWTLKNLTNLEAPMFITDHCCCSSRWQWRSCCEWLRSYDWAGDKVGGSTFSLKFEVDEKWEL